MIDWKKLRQAEGPATRVPVQIKALSGDDPREAGEAFRTLCETLVGKNTWYSASGPAAALLVETLPKSARAHGILVLLAEMAGGGHARAWLAPRDEKAPPEAVVQAFEERRKILLGLASSEDPKLRAAVLALFAMLPALSEETLPIAKAATKDSDEVVRASAVLALARLAELDPNTKGTLADASKDVAPIVRGAATLARLRNERGLPLEDVASGIESWLGWVVTEAGGETKVLPWFGGAWPVSAFQFLDGPSHGLVELAHHRGETKSLVDILVGMAPKSESGAFSKRAGMILIEIGGFSRFQPQARGLAVVALREDLSSEQQEIATKIAGTWLLPGAGFGLPAAGACRKRWIGASPSDVLEKVVDLTVDAEEVTGPLWWARRELLAAGADLWLPHEVAQHLSGLDRWYAMVEFGVNSYGGGFGELEAKDLAREIAALPVDERFFHRLAEVADDLAARFAAAEREGTPLWLSFTTSTLLCWPLVRAKRPIEPRWDPLVYVGEQAIAREMLTALPPERREARVWKCAPLGPNIGETLSWLVPVFDLVPSERIAENIATQLSKGDRRSDLRDMGKLEPYLEIVRDVAKKHPNLQKFLSGVT